MTDKRLDKTQLHEDIHGTDVHRDYFAHYSRWSWSLRQIPRGSRILDVGSGADIPFAKVAQGQRGFRALEPKEVVCVDLNKIKVPKRQWLTVYEKFDFTERWHELIDGDDDNLFDAIICFEVIEHMDEKSGDKLLEGMRQCLAPDGRIYLSTPVFNGKAARNHIHEYEIEELRNKIEANYLEIEARYGTFANVPTIKKVCTDEERKILEEIIDWHGNDMASVFLAFKYPDSSRNNVWVLKHAEADDDEEEAAPPF